jgi:hypothetical protein
VVGIYEHGNEPLGSIRKQGTIGLGAFAASELDKVFSGYQPC